MDVAAEHRATATLAAGRDVRPPVTATTRAPRVLDAQERIAEILFGLIMALSFTGALEIATAQHADVHTAVVGALGCNVAWGIIDGVMFLVSQLVYRGREVTTWRNFAKAADDPSRRAALADEVPAAVVDTLTGDDLARLQSHATEQVRNVRVRLRVADVLGALLVCVLVVAATFPVVLPYWWVHDAAIARRISNGIAIVMLYVAGVILGRFGGGHGHWLGLVMVVIGVLLVGVTLALGG